MKMLGMLSQDETGQYRVIAGGRSYKVLLASLTYFKAEIGDEITIVVPKDSEANWAAVENVIKAGTSSSAGTSGAAETGENPLPKRNADPDADMELAE